jgi:hypothetical protein
MIVPYEEPSREIVNRAGKWHFKIVEIGDRLNEKKNSYIRVTCLSSNNRLFHFPIYPNKNGMKLIHQLADAIGIEYVTENEETDTSKFVGGFFNAILGEYAGESELYEDGYYVKSVWRSNRRYDKTQSWKFGRVKLSDRGI